MYFDDILDRVAELVEEVECELGEPVSADSLGLDPRAGYGCVLYVIEDAIVVKGNTRNLDYYGGFEYVKPEYRSEIGRLTIFSAECERVEEHIEICRSQCEAA